MKKYCILYVDDEETNLRVFNSIFRRYYRVLTAASGEEGLELLRQEAVQLIITDQRMPRMTGLEFLGEAMNITPSAIRIVLTAYSDVETTIKGINEYGIYRYLVKPWVKSEMRLTIDKALETWQLKQDKQALFQELQTVNATLENKVQDRTQNLLAINQALRQAKQRLEEASQTRDLFLSTVTHEMRNPLNIIVQAAHILQSDDLSEKERSKQLDILDFSSKTLLSLINDLLDLSKLEAGKLEFEQITFDPKTIFTQVKDSWLPKTQEKGIDFSLKLPKDLPLALVGDPLRLNQILTNLVGNAVKFTETGSIRINVNLKRESPETIALEVEIEDTGVGIPQEKLSEVFELYTQAGAATSRKYGGTGLGLSITKNLVELQGGTIGAHSQEGEGSVFWFVLNFQIAEEAAQTKDTFPEGALSINGLRVLLVDDDRINQLVTRRVLTQWEIEVSTALDGQEAIEALEEEDFDMVLMDLQMPVMDGREATQYIRRSKNPRWRNLPVVALTGEPPEGDLKELGFNGWLLKPYKPEDMKAILQKHHPKKQTFPLPDFGILEEIAGENQAFRHQALNLLSTHLRELLGALEEPESLKQEHQKATGSLQLFKLQALDTQLRQLNRGDGSQQKVREYLTAVQQAVREYA